MQLRSLDHLRYLLGAGCADRTLRPKLAGLSQLLHDSVELPNLSTGEIAAARAAAPRASQLVEEFWSCGLPDTLAHGDVDLDNVAYDGTQLRLFDWTDACLSHPFLDGVHLARSARQHTSGGDRHHPFDAAVAEAFAAPWRARYPRADVDRALQLAPAIDRIFQAISIERIHRSQEETSAGNSPDSSSASSASCLTYWLRSAARPGRRKSLDQRHGQPQCAYRRLS